MVRKNKNWRSFESNEDQFDRVGRMKPREKKASKSSHLDSEFEQDEGLWINEFPDYFAARVVEVHKRYAFVSPEPEMGAIKTRDVWLSTVARKFLQAKKEQRNFIVVGDRVCCTLTNEDNAGVVTDLPQCVIQKLAPRQSLIKRMDPSKSNIEHVLASNVNQLLVVASFTNPTVKWGLID
ncbi:MAG: hypothetical protein NT027_19830, partial [Proteobacteria bacterium]|nr:hypothetical protein [Pseudomonadota bacterium]